MNWNSLKEKFKKEFSDRELTVEEVVKWIDDSIQNNGILPCPFCQSKAELKTVDDGSPKEFYDVRCTNDDCYLESGAGWSFNSPKHAITYWNKRK